jgi:hypothetical protein
MGTVLPVWAGLIHESYIGLMDESSWLQGVALALVPEMASRKSTEFLVHEWREVIEGTLVTLRPIDEKSCHFVGP